MIGTKAKRVPGVTDVDNEASECNNIWCMQGDERQARSSGASAGVLLGAS